MNTIKINSIVHGDCYNELYNIQKDSVDLIITDPPYGLGESSLKWEEAGWKRVNEKWDTTAETTWIRLIPRILKDGGSILCFCMWKNIDLFLHEFSLHKILQRRNIIVWDKINSIPNITKRGYQFTYELILWYTKGIKHTWNAQSQERDILRCTWSEGNSKRLHPTQKPVLLMSKLIELHSNINDLVLDPFAGSGTVAVACQKLNRRFICIEKEKKYVDIAQKRLDYEIGESRSKGRVLINKKVF